MKVYVHGSGHLAKITREFISVLDKSYNIRWSSIADADVVWCCEDIENQFDGIESMNGILELAGKSPHSLFLISSQLPVGSIKVLEAQTHGVRFAYCPENFKQSDGWEAFQKQKRFIVGYRHKDDIPLLEDLFSFGPRLYLTSIESAEMIKHAINSYLGMCIEFINEIRDICEVVGADIKEVERGLLTEERVSPNAPLHAGDPFGGGHIDRDLSYLQSILKTELISTIQSANARRRS